MVKLEAELLAKEEGDLEVVFGFDRQVERIEFRPGFVAQGSEEADHGVIAVDHSIKAAPVLGQRHQLGHIARLQCYLFEVVQHAVQQGDIGKVLGFKIGKIKACFQIGACSLELEDVAADGAQGRVFGVAIVDKVLRQFVRQLVGIDHGTESSAVHQGHRLLPARRSQSGKGGASGKPGHGRHGLPQRLDLAKRCQFAHECDVGQHGQPRQVYPLGGRP